MKRILLFFLSGFAFAEEQTQVTLFVYEDSERCACIGIFGTDANDFVATVYPSSEAFEAHISRNGQAAQAYQAKYPLHLKSAYSLVSFALVNNSTELSFEPLSKVELSSDGSKVWLLTKSGVCGEFDLKKAEETVAVNFELYKDIYRKAKPNHNGFVCEVSIGSLEKANVAAADAAPQPIEV